MGFLLRNAFTQSIVYRNTNKMTPGPESLLVMVSASLTLQISGFCKWSLSFSWHLIEYTLEKLRQAIDTMLLSPSVTEI